MITATNEETGEPIDRSVLDEAGAAFVPETQHLDLSKEEKRRTTALMLAIQAYRNLIIPDAKYLKVASDLAQKGRGPEIHPATIDAMVEAAIKFDYMIATGRMLSFVEREEPTGEGWIESVQEVGETGDGAEVSGGAKSPEVQSTPGTDTTDK